MGYFDPDNDDVAAAYAFDDHAQAADMEHPDVLRALSLDSEAEARAMAEQAADATFDALTIEIDFYQLEVGVCSPKM